MSVRQSEITSFQQLSAGWSRVLGAATTSTLGAALEVCLEDLGRFTGVDVAFVTLVDDDERVCDDWHWIREGHDAIAPAVGSQLRETFASVTEFVKLGHVVAVSDIDEIELSPSERAMATANDTRAIVIVPVQISSALIGLAGLLVLGEPREWDRSTVAQMKLLSELLVRAVIRTRDRGALALADARARRISEFIPEGLLLVATDGTIEWASPSFGRMSGTTTRDLEGRPVGDIAHPEERESFLAAVRQSLHQPTTTSLRIARYSDWRWCDVSLRLASEPDSNVPDEILISVRDNHDRQIETEELARATELDALTGVANRVGLSRALADLGTRHMQVTIAYCDIDDFKQANDTYGHDAGDQLLRSVARALASAVRPGDLVARLGGDEFVVAIADPGNVRDAVAVGERLLAAVRNAPFDGPSATLSIGIAGPGPASTAAAILRAADQAMYAAKRSGKNRFIARTLDPPTDLGAYSPT
jgi:diguanylate cyclase (GGDEF)-like protein/PAS domain S-box-containing protein